MGWNGRPIDTARLILRAPRADDVPRMMELLADPDVVRHTARVPHPYTKADGERFIAACAEERAAGAGVTLAIEERVSGQMIGCIGAPFAPGNAEMGYWLGRPYWSQGYATEAARRLLRFLFEVCSRGLVWACPEPSNPASRRVLEKCGLAFERREHMLFPARGDERDVDVLSIDREHWTASHAARKQVLVVAAALIDSDGRVLLAQRPTGKSMAGLWEFPGGKLDAGETPEAALVRELHEELGIDITESCLAAIGFVSHDYDTFHLLMPLYACRQWRGQLTPREGQSLEWVRAARLTDYKMPPADVPLVAALRDLL
ncbi:MAG TPA: 8-oxo-dGTP diphosphatase MutT [Magnetospirillaceae bacterium]